MNLINKVAQQTPPKPTLISPDFYVDWSVKGKKKVNRIRGFDAASNHTYNTSRKKLQQESHDAKSEHKSDESTQTWGWHNISSFFKIQVTVPALTLRAFWSEKDF